MTKKIKLIDYDVVYLSYDEPTAEKNYADLLTKIPWAKRVHGVDGSDSAHKACARLAETDRVTIIDGDNIIKSELIQQTVEFVDSVDLSKSVLSYAAENIINGLQYGNGGIKNWDRELILNMKTHENADPSNDKTQVDFCWDINYLQLKSCMSYVHNNATPQQAWRAGFREGVKMSLLEGSKPSKDLPFDKQIHWKNYHRLVTWMNVGADVEHGIWAMYGARLGCWMTNLKDDWDHTNVRDFKYLNSLWNTLETSVDFDLSAEMLELGTQLRDQLGILTGPSILDADQSKFFKTLYTNPPRMKNNWVIE